MVILGLRLLDNRVVSFSQDEAMIHRPSKHRGQNFVSKNSRNPRISSNFGDLTKEIQRDSLRNPRMHSDFGYSLKKYKGDP